MFSSLGLTQLLANESLTWRIAACQRLVERIAAYEVELRSISPEDLHRRSLALRYEAQSGRPLKQLIPEAYALVRETSRRTLGMRHFDVQMLGGIVLAERRIAEMQTGEGKTLTATLPMYLFALQGRGAMLATVNDYLAKRDAEGMKPLYERLGMTVGVVESSHTPVQRQQAYACDIVYGTAKEFGFDFLRDRLAERSRDEGETDFLGPLMGNKPSPRQGSAIIQRPPHFVLIDEADSILIDEAGTPLIIATGGEVDPTRVACFQFAAAVAEKFTDPRDYFWDAKPQRAELTAAGRQLVRELASADTLGAVPILTLYDDVERAIRAARAFQLDRHYVIREGEIQIVDEFTGRIADGRKWRDGLHQAVEAKEGVEVTADTSHAARITIQDYFLRFPHLSGMTGTARTSARELRRIYRLRTEAIPTNRPPIRQHWPTRITGNTDAKWNAIVAEVRELHAQNRPVLIGTRSIDKSHALSQRLKLAGIDHDVLNANHEAKEAEIVAQAGQLGRVTVATNMAGRGTDIRLGPGVAELGGLHVIVTELHEAARVDRQIAGRCGRQGDPGTWRLFLSLDDDILSAGMGPVRGTRLKQKGLQQPDQPPRLERLFRRAQRLAERQRFRQRQILMHHERERQKAQRQMGLDPYLDSPE